MILKPVFCKFFLPLLAALFFAAALRPEDDDIISYALDLKSGKLKMDLYWKDEKGETLKSIQNLKQYTERKKRTLVFAMNAGMYRNDNSPQGLFVQEGETLFPLDTASGSGNFYMKPNGVFCLTKENIPVVCTTSDFVSATTIRYATQSGPMLVIDGKIHPAFKEGSTNLNIRNGVSILPDHRVVFAMSKKEINFYDFASYFKKLGCQNALYLDGFVSRTYLPEKNWTQTDGNFGVIIGVTK